MRVQQHKRRLKLICSFWQVAGVTVQPLVVPGLSSQDPKPTDTVTSGPYSFTGHCWQTPKE